MFPDDAVRAEVEAQQHRLPLRYFVESMSSTRGSDERRSGYLAFGVTYADELSEADARGWPVARLAGGHLHMLVDPVGVADAIEGLLAAMT